MSEWLMWGVDGDDERLTTIESDIVFSWRWRDRNCLEAVLPAGEELKVARKGTLCFFYCCVVGHPDLHFRAALSWDTRVYPGELVRANDLTMTIDAGIIALLAEYLPTRPPEKSTSTQKVR